MFEFAEFCNKFLRSSKKIQVKKTTNFPTPKLDKLFVSSGSRRSLFLTQPFFESSRKASGRLISRAKVRIKAGPKKMTHVT